MKLMVRRTLTAVGTGAAIFGAVHAVIGVTPVPQATQIPALKAALQAQQQARDKLRTAVRDVHAQDRQARTQIGALQASIQVTRLALAAGTAAPRVAAPVIHTTTGASGGDDGGGGDD